VPADQHQIFKDGSTTYYYSSRAFPRSVRDDVTTLYGFVRTADDFIDTVPQQDERFRSFREDTLTAFDGEPADDPVIDDFIELCRETDIDQDWVEAFLHSMAMDLEKETYQTIEDVKEYMYGSAEVIGLMMCQLLDVDEQAHEAARMQGRAMQYINFLRDIREDHQLGRQYIPQDVLEEYGLTDLSEETARDNEDAFIEMMRSEIGRYRDWQDQADAGYSHLPLRARIPVRTAARLYRWTAREIHEDPLIVYREKVKPTKPRVLRELVGALL
jgi:phytoene synthase